MSSPTPSLKSKQSKPSVDDLVNDVACSGLQTPTATVLPTIGSGIGGTSVPLGGSGATLGGVSSTISAPATRPVSSTRDEGMFRSTCQSLNKHQLSFFLFTLILDLDAQAVIASIVTDSGLSESSESAVTLTTDNLQQHVLASSSAITPIAVTQSLPVGLGVIGSNNYGTTGLSSGPAGAGGVGVGGGGVVGVNVGIVNTAALMEMGHSRNSSNTSQVSRYLYPNM